ncbi:MAG: hypothetical protein IKG27_06900 [Bacilli bacterium]|nr:hypothetical protein [Bacilli bacterium]
MKKKRKYLFLTLILTMFALTACSKIDSKIIGTWECPRNGYTATYVFKSDGTGNYIFKSNEINVAAGEGETNDELTYETQKGKLSMTYNGSKDASLELEYKIDNDNLILKNAAGSEFTCTKK